MAGYNRISGRSLVESQVLRGYRFTRITSWKAARNKLFSSGYNNSPLLLLHLVRCLFDVHRSIYIDRQQVLFILIIFSIGLSSYYYFILVSHTWFHFIYFPLFRCGQKEIYEALNIVFFFFFSKEFVFSPLFLSTSLLTNYAIFDCTAIFTIASRSSFFDNPAIV